MANLTKEQRIAREAEKEAQLKLELEAKIKAELEEKLRAEYEEKLKSAESDTKSELPLPGQYKIRKDFYVLSMISSRSRSSVQHLTCE